MVCCLLVVLSCPGYQRVFLICVSVQLGLIISSLVCMRLYIPPSKHEQHRLQVLTNCGFCEICEAVPDHIRGISDARNADMKPAIFTLQAA